MNPNLIWDELQAKMADNVRVAEHRHLEGDAHRAATCAAQTTLKMRSRARTVA